MQMNYILEAAIFSVIMVQIIKGLTHYRHTREFDFHFFFSNDINLSSKLTFISALVTAIWKQEGIETINFAISLTLALIVTFDSLVIGREMRRQAKCLNKLQAHLNIQNKPLLQEEIGHDPIQIFESIILGIVGSVIYFCVTGYL